MRLDRRGKPRTPGKFTDTLDTTFRTLRQHESQQQDGIWRELDGEWKKYVAERKRDYIELKTITLADGDFLRSMGIECRFPWWISSPTDLMDRGTPLAPKSENKNG